MTGTTDINVNEREGSEYLQIVFSTESSESELGGERKRGRRVVK